MLETALSIALALITLAWVLNLYRLIIGPSLPDRVLALDTMYINSIALIVVYGIQVDSKLYFEAAMLIALIGFVSTVAVAKYVTRGDIIE
ncbi:K+/H+ antiporter subunit F [Alcanivorax sp.]|uniref:K+/H+ antiporter subunit F n=1 Tax=Alcanivorax sp. TaxID=1872427 RepID=UPI000C67DF55|nr:K+/H+ antiporter subunit F [Alcanivorax sp.]MBQ24379.1 K+/H+ antiporter subunit F [Alcanivorax sp.]|tara:strand:+ start:282 stop:551 length:270 start_codon:yes stop_codon:yes gene_type:complete